MGIFGDQIDDVTLSSTKFDAVTQTKINSRAILDKTVDFTVTVSQHGAVFSNAGTTGVVVAQLPGAPDSIPVGMEVGFVRNSANFALRITPAVGENITMGGVPPFSGALPAGDFLSLGQVGSFIVLKRTNQNGWTSVTEGGVLNPEPCDAQLLLGAISDAAPDGIVFGDTLVDNNGFNGQGQFIRATTGQSVLGFLLGAIGGNNYTDGVELVPNVVKIAFINRVPATPWIIPTGTSLVLNVDGVTQHTLIRTNDIIIPAPTGAFFSHDYYVDVNGRMYLSFTDDNGLVTPVGGLTYAEACFSNGAA